MVLPFILNQRKDSRKAKTDQEKKNPSDFQRKDLMEFKDYLQGQEKYMNFEVAISPAWMGPCR